MNLAMLKKPKLLAFGVPAALMSQCAPQQCAPTPAPAAASTVTSVIDGDTVRVSGGETIRLIGIDAPESGQCGAMDATLHLRHLVLDQTVALRPGARDDRDRYGRLLRYVETASVDAGLNMVQNGFAVARYDSRDGYGAHTREAAYVAADAGTPNVCGFDPTAPAPSPVPAPTPQPPTGGGCHPNYTPCLPQVGDLDCGEIAGHLKPVRVIGGSDPYRLDADGDGRGCDAG
jgi:endonuclease YncB( thermonuclease family)